MRTINIPFESKDEKRIIFAAGVMTADFKSFGIVRFKLDTGADVTTISRYDLEKLGYDYEFLENTEKCPYLPYLVSTAGGPISLQYIKNVKIKFGDREIDGCRVHFSLKKNLRNLFGLDIIRHFNLNIDFDEGLIKLSEVRNKPQISKEESPLHIYMLHQMKRDDLVEF